LPTGFPSVSRKGELAPLTKGEGAKRERDLFHKNLYLSKYKAMTHIDTQYLNLVQEILKAPKKDNRT
jgi:hypothetical protein